MEPSEPNSDSAKTDHTYAKNDGPFKNPLKGWNSGWDGGNDHPESSVGFQYIAQATDAIQALAEEYDDDPQIYAVQMGVIGYWGEWHAYGSSFEGDRYEISDATQNAILNAYTSSFNNAQIMGRYPWREPTQSTTGIGFHNDFFVADNGHSEEFDVAVATGSQWTNNPIGGEVPPRDDGEANREKATFFNGREGLDVIEQGRYSTMKAGAYRVTAGQNGYAGYMKLHKKMGYNYQIDIARFAENTNRSKSLTVEVIGTNLGVAPMYFDWDVQFALLDANDRPVATQNAASDLTSIMPGSMFNFSSEIGLTSVNPGTYMLAIRIVQPHADKPGASSWKLDARNTYIQFANDLPVINGSWSNSGLVGGWSELGGVIVQ